MKNLKIGIKLLITFMIIIALFIATVVVAIIGLTQNASKYTDFYTVGYQVTNRVMNMRRGLQIIVKDLSFMTIDEDSAKCEEYKADLEKEMTALEENATWLFSNFTGEQELLDSFESNVRKAVELQETVISLSGTDMKAAQTMLLQEYQPLVEEAVNNLIHISETVENNAKNDYEETVKMQDMLVYAQLGMAAGALVLTLILATYLIRMITRPVRQLEIAAGKITSGNFDIQVDYESKDELGSLARNFREMAAILGDVINDASRLLTEMANGNFDVRTQAEERYVGKCKTLLMSIRKLNIDLSGTLSQINQSADQVASGSSQVSYGAQDLAQGATAQAAAVEELVATIEDISRQVKDTADNALEAKNQSNMAGSEVEECNQQMREMTAAMEEITRTSNEIGKIIKTIEDIAFQTNILSLNAAVEATRAGTAGKGFAVVAEEVRNLASKSAAASKDTADLIEDSIEAVARGTHLADETAQSLLKVVEGVRAASSTVDRIADAARDQSGAIEQVALGVDQISGVVQTNSATAEESAAASEELSSQAEMLKDLVAKFSLRDDGATYSSSTDTFGSIDID